MKIYQKMALFSSGIQLLVIALKPLKRNEILSERTEVIRSARFDLDDPYR